MHEVGIVTPFGSAGRCTAYAVGPRTIMIAEHCLGEFPTFDLFLIDEVGNKNYQMAAPSDVILDTNDHAIVVLDALDVKSNHFDGFDVWISDLGFYTPQQGDKVFMYGSPMSILCKDCYREGYFSGWSEKLDDKILMWFAFAGGPGDSGSFIFDDKGHLVGEVTYGTPYGFMGQLWICFYGK